MHVLSKETWKSNSICLVGIVYFLWISPMWFAGIFHLWRTIRLVQPKMPEASVYYKTTTESMADRTPFLDLSWIFPFAWPTPPPFTHFHAFLFRNRYYIFFHNIVWVLKLQAVGVTKLVGWQFVIFFVIRYLTWCLTQFMS